LKFKIYGIKERIMKIFTKEMLVNSAVTLAVVMIGLYVHDKFVAPKLGGTPTEF
jgi:hypothetical protein